jgi:hypothetical protein
LGHMFPGAIPHKWRDQGPLQELELSRGFGSAKTAKSSLENGIREIPVRYAVAGDRHGRACCVEGAGNRLFLDQRWPAGHCARIQHRRKNARRSDALFQAGRITMETPGECLAYRARGREATGDYQRYHSKGNDYQNCSFHAFSSGDQGQRRPGNKDNLRNSTV